MYEIPVYLFTGFLEAGKTEFIKGTLTDPQFNSGETTLMIICEDGETQYDDLSEDIKSDLTFTYVESEEDFTEDLCMKLENQYQPDRVIIECNGMWNLGDFYQKLPNNWPIVQEIDIIDSNTFAQYNTMFRNLMVEKIAGAEFVLFNRVTKGCDLMQYHQVVRAISRRIQIAYEYTDGTGEIDNIPDPLPYDINADMIELQFDDYALWMRDLLEDPEKYVGKKIHLTAKALPNIKINNGFNFGRQVMTCCVQDIKFMGFITENKTGKEIDLPGWYEIWATIANDYQKNFHKKMPSLKAYKIEAAAEPAEDKEVATFY